MAILKAKAAPLPSLVKKSTPAKVEAIEVEEAEEEYDSTEEAEHEETQEEERDDEKSSPEPTATEGRILETLMNHEHRLGAIEAVLFRMRNVL